LSSSQEIDEDKLAATLLAPASGEPDLVLVLGSPTQVPESLMWELAYSELVFLNVPWLKCDVEHIQMAIDDFQRRDRRFGGVDS
jgi:undecaprenyl diphosphate synthase